MKYLLSVVLVLLKTFCSESGAKPIFLVSVNTTKDLRNSSIKSNTPAYMNTQKNTNTNIFNTTLNKITEKSQNGNKSITLATLHKEKESRKTNRSATTERHNSKHRDKHTHGRKIKKSKDHNIFKKKVTHLNNTLTVPSEKKKLKTVKEIINKLNDLQNFKPTPGKYYRRQIDNSIKPESLILNSNLTGKTGQLKHDRNFKENDKFEVVDSYTSKKNKTKGIKTTPYSVIKDIKLEDSILSSEANKRVQNPRRRKLKKDKHKNILIKDYLQLPKTNRTKHHVKATNHKDFQHFHNGIKIPLEIKPKTEGAPGNRLPVLTRIHPQKYKTHNWNTFKKTSKIHPFESHSRLYTMYSTLKHHVNFRNSNFKTKRSTQKSDKEKNKYVDSLEEDNAEYLSKDLEAKNSQYSIENFDGPPTRKETWHKKEPLSANKHVHNKAHLDDLHIKVKNDENKYTVQNFEVVTQDDFITSAYDEYKPKKSLDNVDLKIKKTIKPNLKTKSILPQSPKWRKLTHSSSYTDEEDVLIKNIKKALVT